MSEPQFGTEEGVTCWREGCQGVISIQPIENCQCHINPPCSACTSAKLHCPECEWLEPDQYMNGFEIFHGEDKNGAWKSWKETPLDPRKIDYRVKAHTNASQLCVGVYPEGTTREDVEKRCKGTFGGRFQKFAAGHFEYVAYTD